MARRGPRDARRRAVAAAPDPADRRPTGVRRPHRGHPVSRGAHAASHAVHEARRTSATGRERVVALDGLRAFALLIIMGYHFGVAHFGGGFFSLDIFYVLSGYLITGLLLGEWARSARIRLGAFWARRARRLLPALCVVLVVVTLVVRFTYPAGLYPDLRMADLSALFYFSNWWQIAASGNYFVATGAVSPLTHTWSLAVEEQFYLVWPLVVLAVLHVARRSGRRGGAAGGAGAGSAEVHGGAGDGSGDGVRRPDRGVEALLAVSVVGVVASATEMAWLYHPGADITRLYFGTDTHAQSILVGSVLACVLTLVQRHRGLAGMAPVAADPWCPGGPHRRRSGRGGRHPHLDRHLVGHQRPRLPGRLPPVGPVGRRHRHRGGVRAPVAPWPGCCRCGPWCGWAPSPTAPTCGTSPCSSSSTRPAPASAGRPAGRAGGCHLRAGRRQLLPGGAPGHGGHLLAPADRPRPRSRRPGRHRGGGGGRHRGPGAWRRCPCTRPTRSRSANGRHSTPPTRSPPTRSGSCWWGTPWP